VFCPNCGLEQVCGCKSCFPIHPYEKAYRFAEDGENIICAGCGLTAHADWWTNLEVEVRNIIDANKKGDKK
jgi:hypothetical protein